MNTIVKRICRDDTEALDLIDQATQNPHGVHVGAVSNGNSRPVGNEADNALRKLRKDRPDLHAKVIDRIIEERKSAQARAAEPKELLGHGGSRTSRQGVNHTLTGGSGNAEYLAARIARDRPDILERMKTSEFMSAGGTS